MSEQEVEQEEEEAPPAKKNKEQDTTPKLHLHQLHVHGGIFMAIS